MSYYECWESVKLVARKLAVLATNNSNDDSGNLGWRLPEVKWRPQFVPYVNAQWVPFHAEDT